MTPMVDSRACARTLSSVILGNAFKHKRVARIKHLPVWAFHGAKDKAVPLARAEATVKALKEAGGNVNLTVYPDLEHDSWTTTYNNPELYEWFLKHRRTAN